MAEAVEELAQDELGTGVDVNEPFGHTELLADESAQRSGIGLSVVVAVGHLGLCGSDSLVNRQ